MSTHPLLDLQLSDGRRDVGFRPAHLGRAFSTAEDVPFGCGRGTRGVGNKS